MVNIVSVNRIGDLVEVGPVILHRCDHRKEKAWYRTVDRYQAPGLGRWVMELRLTFGPQEFFEHLIGRRDDFG